MTRKALLIGGPGAKGSSRYLQGVERDLDAYKRFLLSPLGGAWENTEIISHMSPSEADIKRDLALLKAADYSFVLFSGHGYYSKAASSTILELRDRVELDSSFLRVGAAKQTVILDCCRVVYPAVTKSVVEAAMDSLVKALTLDANECRKYYDKRIQECPSGLIVLHSSSINETSGDDSQLGGVYCANLIKSAEKWKKKGNFNTVDSYYVCDVPKAHDLTIPEVTRRSGGRQNPQIEKPKSTPYFPFAIVA